jgi:hypothetical protein
LTQLRWLELGVDTLTRGLAEQVVELPRLARLDLHLKTFEAGAVAALAKAPALRLLTVTTPEEQTPPAELVRLEQLRYLWVGHRAFGNPERLPFQTALPGCRVDHWPCKDEGDFDWS